MGMLYRAVYSSDPLSFGHLAQHTFSLNILFRTILFQGFAIDSVYPDDFDDDDDGCKFEFQWIFLSSFHSNVFLYLRDTHTSTDYHRSYHNISNLKFRVSKFGERLVSSDEDLSTQTNENGNEIQNCRKIWSNVSFSNRPILFPTLYLVSKRESLRLFGRKY